MSATQTALEILGYDKVYNYSVTVKTPGDPQKWIAALEAKFEGKGEVFGSEEWDEILGDYDVCILNHSLTRAMRNGKKEC